MIYIKNLSNINLNTIYKSIIMTIDLVKYYLNSYWTYYYYYNCDQHKKQYFMYRK